MPWTSSGVIVFWRRAATSSAVRSAKPAGFSLSLPQFERTYAITAAIFSSDRKSNDGIALVKRLACHVDRTLQPVEDDHRRKIGRQEQVGIVGKRRKLTFDAFRVGLVAAAAVVGEQARPIQRGGGCHCGRGGRRRRARPEVGGEVVEDRGALIRRDPQAEARHVVQDRVPGTASDPGRIDDRLQVVAGLAVAVDEIAARPVRQIEPPGGRARPWRTPWRRQTSARRTSIATTPCPRVVKAHGVDVPLELGTSLSIVGFASDGDLHPVDPVPLVATGVPAGEAVHRLGVAEGVGRPAHQHVVFLGPSVALARPVVPRPRALGHP